MVYLLSGYATQLDPVVLTCDMVSWHHGIYDDANKVDNWPKSIPVNKLHRKCTQFTNAKQINKRTQSA